MRILLNDGRYKPQLAMGLWPLSSADACAAVSEALRLGWRAFDTAARYDNEEGVGDAIRAASVARDEIFVTTKLPPEDQGHDAALRGLDDSLRCLGLDHVDLYLIHWPARHGDVRASTWRAFVKMKEEGRARSIGVSNFSIAHLQQLIEETGIVPAVNQVELHPRLQQRRLRAFHAEYGIATECWSPLARGQALGEPTVAALALKHDRSPAEIVLRWHLQSGLIVIARTHSPARLKQNLQALDFELDDDDMASMATLDDRHGRIGPDPEGV